MHYDLWDADYTKSIRDYLGNTSEVRVTERVVMRDRPLPSIKRVIFNPPATIIFWNDNTKSVVQCQGGEEFDPEKGFALAYLKKLLGNNNEFNKEIHKWVVE